MFLELVENEDKLIRKEPSRAEARALGLIAQPEPLANYTCTRGIT